MTQKSKDTGERDGDYTFGTDRFIEQRHFLLSIQEHACDVLGALKKSVLPIFTQAQAVQGSVVHATPGYDPETWPAIWDWAIRFHLVASSDVPLLKSRKAVAIAGRMDEDAVYRSLPCDTEPFPTGSSSLTFALPTLIRVVLRTLASWANGKRTLKWTFPECEATIYETQSIENLAQTSKEMLGDDLVKKMIADGQLATPDPPPFVYDFTTRAWNVRRETRAVAERRILDELKLQLHRWLDRHEEIAMLMNLKKRTRKRKNWHYRCLVLYQVKGFNKAELAREVKETWEAKGTTAENLSQTVRHGIQTAAELIIGPSWQSWLLRGKSGRPSH